MPTATQIPPILNVEALKPLIEATVVSVLSRLPDDRLAYGEAEAAALLGLESYQLRDERLRGRIKASTGPGRKVLYSRDQLLEYLASRPWTPPAASA